LRIYELPFYQRLPQSDVLYLHFDSYFNAIWLVVITVTTVGYGDVFACTLPGRIITCFIAIGGAFLMAIVVTVVSENFTLGKEEQVACLHMQVTRSACLVV
jgi:hypothetical protein